MLFNFCIQVLTIAEYFYVTKNLKKNSKNKISELLLNYSLIITAKTVLYRVILTFGSIRACTRRYIFLFKIPT